MVDPELDAKLDRLRPKKPDAAASGGSLYNLNRAGLLGEAVVRTIEAAGYDVAGHMLAVAEASATVPTITRQTAWEVMAEAERRGVQIGRDEAALRRGD